MPAINRRTALKLITLSAAALALPAAARRLPPGIPVDRGLFPQSVASGDPRPGSVVLWTRLAAAAWSQDMVLEVAEDAGFEAVRVERSFRVGPTTDGCLKVKVEGLDADRAWFYRFVVLGADGAPSASPTGRTRTAPGPDADRDLRFAVMSCQDFNGRWYNTLLPLLDQELDAILHLGDFIYETTGDPSFQDGTGRRIRFEDAAGALSLGDGGFQAARSLDNYRQLHREYRSDPVLQQLLERAPLIAIWDDHEFADDSWQDVATFHDGRRDERDAGRRRASEQAWFEYMPADLGGGFGGDAVDGAALHPNTRIWRDFRFGKRAAMAFTDYRSARPDHLVPEDAFPGALAFDEPTLREALPGIGASFEDWHARLQPYVEMSDPDYRRYRRPLARALTRAYRAEGLGIDDVRRRVRAILAAPIALPVANAILARHDAGAPFFLDAGQIPEAPGLPRGLSWAGIGKSRLFDAIGSRYFVLAEGYELMAALRAAETGSALGESQSAWLGDTLARQADADWRFIGSSVSFTPLRLDLRRPEIQAPAAWAHEVLLNVDHWDGFPIEREAWLDRFAGPGAVLLSGDIHASFASQHRPSVVEFTVPAVSSKSLGAILARNADGDEATRAAGARLAENLDGLLRAGYPGLRYAQTRRNGTLLLEVGRDTLLARYFEIDGERVGECFYDDPGALAAALQQTLFRVERESGRLELESLGRTSPAPMPLATVPSAALVIAHRGASAWLPEHTLAAYERAIADGADAIEPDLVMTRDGVLVARHENEISGTTDVGSRPEFAGRKTRKQVDGQWIEGWFTEDFSLAELKTLRARERLPQLRSTANDGRFEVPTFDEIVALVAAESGRRGSLIGIVPEIKHPSHFAALGLAMEQPLLDALAAHEYTRHAPVLVQSFETANLRALRQQLPRGGNIRLLQLVGAPDGSPWDTVAAGMPVPYSRMVSPEGLREVAGYADVIGPPYPMLQLQSRGQTYGSALVDVAHAAGLQVVAYTFRPENIFIEDRFRDAGEPAARNEAASLREIRAYLSAGMDGFFTDDPALGRLAMDAP